MAALGTTAHWLYLEVGGLRASSLHTPTPPTICADIRSNIIVGMSVRVFKSVEEGKQFALLSVDGPQTVS